MFDDFYTKAADLDRQGLPFATAVVVRAERPTSGKPGDKAIITADGTLYGWIGGSCAQPSVVREALRAMHDGESRLIRLSPDPHNQVPREGLLDVAMTCFSGGTLEVYIEPHQPRPQLMIIGGLPVARALAELSKAMHYRVLIVDPTADGEPPAYADELLTDLSVAVGRITPQSFVVVATHGQYDELALEQILQADPGYIGLVASRTRAEAIRTQLVQQGLDPHRLRAIHAPAGIDIGARRGDEIALSIMAEIVAFRRGRERSIAIELPPRPAESKQPEIAIDPVCAMEVAIAGAQHHYLLEGTIYYFCCPGCRGRFIKNPQRFLAANHASAG
jgi:xanthine dehydrogenase accessory factor